MHLCAGPLKTFTKKKWAIAHLLYCHPDESTLSNRAITAQFANNFSLDRHYNHNLIALQCRILK